MSFIFWHAIYIAGAFLAVQAVLSAFVLGTVLVDNILVARLRRGG